jgi:hypothetical protein
MKPPTDRVLADTIDEAIRLRLAMKAEGATPAELDAAMEKTLRAAWPFTRTWIYRCGHCQDTGLVMAVCRRGSRCDGVSTRTDYPHQRIGKYRRLCAIHPDSDTEHTSGAPCFCTLGARFQLPTPPSADEFTGAGTKPMTRIGRK